MLRFDKNFIRMVIYINCKWYLNHQHLTELLDVNNDGQITQAELTKYLADHKVLTEQLDENNDGDITKGELIGYLALHQDLTEQLDENDDGDTTKSEAPAPGPFGQIFGNTGQFLQNFVQGWVREMWMR